MAHRIQRIWRLHAGSCDERNRRVAQLCVQAIANLNWKYYGTGYYKGDHEDFYSAQVESTLSLYEPCDDECSYLTEGYTREYSLWHSDVDDEFRNDRQLVFTLAYLEARCYLGQHLTDDDLYSSWEGKPSPWLDAILAKSGRQMSDWAFYWS